MRVLHELGTARRPGGEVEEHPVGRGVARVRHRLRRAVVRRRVRRRALRRCSDHEPGVVPGHLIELRRRLLWCVAAIAAGFFICLYFAKPIFAILVQPLLAAGQGKLIYTDIFEAFFVEVKVAFFAALMFSFPVTDGVAR